MQTVDWKLRRAVRQIAYVWLLHVFSPRGLSQASSQYGSWSQEPAFQEIGSRNCLFLKVWALKLAHHPFCFILLFQVVTKLHPGSRRGAVGRGSLVGWDVLWNPSLGTQPAPQPQWFLWKLRKTFVLLLYRLRKVSGLYHQIKCNH